MPGPLGQFDPELRDLAWFDPELLEAGWFDPDLIDAAAGGPAFDPATGFDWSEQPGQERSIAVRRFQPDTEAWSGFAGPFPFNPTFGGIDWSEQPGQERQRVEVRHQPDPSAVGATPPPAVYDPGLGFPWQEQPWERPTAERRFQPDPEQAVSWPSLIPFSPQNPARMIQVGGGTSAGSGTLVVTLPATPADGDVIVIGVITDSDVAGVTGIASIAGAGGGAWTAQQNRSGVAMSTTLFVSERVQAAPDGVVTITFNGSPANAAGRAVELAGVAPRQDASDNNTGTSSAPDPAGILRRNKYDVSLVVGAWTAGPTAAPTSDYASLGALSAGGLAGDFIWRRTSNDTAGAFEFRTSWNLSSSVAWSTFEVDLVALPPEDQLAPLWQEQPGQERYLAQRWFQPDTEQFVSVQFLQTTSTTAQQAAIFTEYSQDRWLGRWYPPFPELLGISSEADAPPPSVINTYAPIWQEQPGQERSLQVRWFQPATESWSTFTPPPAAYNPGAGFPWQEQPGQERSIDVRWFQNGTEVWTPNPIITLASSRRLKAIQYHALVYSPDANGGPGTPKLELDPDLLNLVWQQNQNLPGQAAFALQRRSKKVDQIEWMVDHIKVFRETGSGLHTLFAGKLVKPLIGVTDILCYAWDYLAFLQLSVTGYKTMYATKKIGTELVAPEWAAAKALTNSPFTFVTTGTIEDPLALDGVTPIRTNSTFGVNLFDRLFTFYTLAEMAMANTANNVKFEITRELPHTFNFWKNYGQARTAYAGVWPGNLVEYDFDAGRDNQRLDLFTVLSDGAGGQTSYEVTTADVNTSTLRRLQAAIPIRTLFGTTAGTTETDQQKAALARQLVVSTRYPRSVRVRPRQGEIDIFAGHDLGDTFRHTIQKADRSGDFYDGYLRLIGAVGAWHPQHGEMIDLYLRGGS